MNVHCKSMFYFSADIPCPEVYLSVVLKEFFKAHHIVEGEMAAGHCAAYTFDGEDIFICHGYSATRNGAAMLIQRPISWTTDGWPEL